MGELDSATAQNIEDVQFDPCNADIADIADSTTHSDADSDADPRASTFAAEKREIHLAWERLEYSVGVKTKRDKKKTSDDLEAQPQKHADKKVIIQNISGEVRPGEILAIMGASGAGKTTLLNLLAGRLTTSRNFATNGKILVNGVKRDPRVFKKLSAYVEQDDKMFGELTVEEQIMFSAMLRLPNSMSVDDKKTRVDQTIQELGLSKVRKSFIGSELIRGVSGGERKRVNVGTELVANPALLFLDEPTTGLDSFNALNVMHTLRKLASAGRTVVTTIHQPRSNIFQLFDKLLLLSEGRVMYFGPAADAVAYFAKLSFACPTQFNPADYFIDLISVDPRSPHLEQRSKARVKLLGDTHDAEPLELEGLNFSEGEVQEAETNMARIAANVKYETSYLTENAWLLKRTVKLTLRERAGNFARLGQTLIFAILLGLIWLNVGRDFDKSDLGDPQLVGNIMALGGILFFLCVNQGFGGVFGVIFVYPLERAVVLRERASSTYRVSTYLLSRTITDIPRNFFFIMLFSLICYWMVGLKATFVAFFTFVLVLMLVVSITEGLTLCIGTFTPDPQTTSAITPIFMILAMLFGGFFISPERIPGAVRWVRWISFIFYGLTALVHNEFEDTPAFAVAEQQYNLEMSKAVALLLLLAQAVFFRLLLYVILRLRGPTFSKTL